MNASESSFSSSHAWRGWLAISGVLIVLDQALKTWISREIPYGSRQPVTDFFNIVYVHNPGAAFSFLADAGGWQRWFFLAIALGAAAFLTWLLRRGVSSRGETIAYVAILGGALGNAIDRMRLGHVVDFLDFHWRGWHWPAFNSADACISLGVAVLILTALVQARHAQPQPR